MLRFGRFELDYQNRQLRCEGRELSLEQRAFDLLWYLANRSGKLVRKDELLEQVWRAQFLSDGALSNSVAKAGDSDADACVERSAGPLPGRPAGFGVAAAPIGAAGPALGGSATADMVSSRGAGWLAAGAGIRSGPPSPSLHAHAKTAMSRQSARALQRGHARIDGSARDWSMPSR